MWDVLDQFHKVMIDPLSWRCHERVRDVMGLISVSYPKIDGLHIYAFPGRDKHGVLEGLHHSSGLGIAPSEGYETALPILTSWRHLSYS